jgi:hypothetical protein
MRATATVLLAALVTLNPPDAAAQRAASHRGFWISLNLGYATTFSDPLYEEFEGSSSADGPSLSLRLGGSPSQRLLLGAESAAWGSGGSIIRSLTGFTAVYYPSPDHGLAVDGVAGLASRSVSYTIITPDESFTVEEEDFGFGFAAGVALDIRFARSFSLTPRLQGTAVYLAGHWAPTIDISLGVIWH